VQEGLNRRRNRWRSHTTSFKGAGVSTILDHRGFPAVFACDEAADKTERRRVCQNTLVRRRRPLFRRDEANLSLHSTASRLCSAFHRSSSTSLLHIFQRPPHVHRYLHSVDVYSGHARSKAWRCQYKNSCFASASLFLLCITSIFSFPSPYLSLVSSTDSYLHLRSHP
jgi:hypothetical protein